MRISIIFLFLILSNIGFAQKKGQATLSKWVTTPPVLDGDLTDWQMPLEQPSPQINIRYRCSNDAEYLYLAVHAPDEYMKSLILHQGMSIWIDTTAKKRDKVGIGYPIPLKESEIESLAGEAKGNEKTFMKLYAEALSEFDLIGFVEEPIRISNLTSKDMKVAAGFDDLRGFLFEMRIPLKQLYQRQANLTESFSLGIYINPPKKSLDDDNGNDQSLFNDRTNGGGITQSNPLLGPSPNQQQYAAPTRQPSMPSFWVKVKLSSGQ